MHRAVSIEAPGQSGDGLTYRGPQQKQPEWGIQDVPITLEHPPPKDLDKYLPNPGVPRANKAATKEMPNGSASSPANQTVLQQHVAFFDRDHDGVIWPHDTFVGFRRVGLGYPISLAAIFVIHGTFSYPTQKHWIPNPLMPIYMDRMHRTKHGSDSESYDTEGRFVSQKFEEIFSKYDKEGKGGLSWNDLQTMLYTQSNVNDFVGWIATRLEWWTTYYLLREDGLLKKERIRGVMDGSIWQQLANEIEQKKKPHKWA